jgi:NAD(P)-dependent dehydrogenase (short-subunit alcohol dehydrogenase family)
VAESIRQTGADAVFVRADVASEEDCLALIAAAETRWGRLESPVGRIMDLRSEM